MISLLLWHKDNFLSAEMQIFLRRVFKFTQKRMEK